MQYPNTESSAETLGRAQKELRAQLENPAAMALIARAAARRLRQPATSLAVRELVADVVADTFSGELPWDPAQPMKKHLRANVLLYATRARRGRGGVVPLEHLPEDLEPGTCDAAPQVAFDERLSHLDRLLPRLRARLHGDAAAERLLALYERGVTRRAHIVRHGLTEREYHNARRRLTSAAIAIDAELTALGVAADDRVVRLSQLPVVKRTRRARKTGADLAGAGTVLASKLSERGDLAADRRTADQHA